MRTFLFLSLGVLLVASAACSSDTFAGDDAGTDAGTSDAAPGDAAPGDASPGDASPGDAGPIGPESGPPTCLQNDKFCSGQNATGGFCDSFDNELAGPSIANWTSNVTSGELRVDDKHFHSCPHSLSASLPAEPDSGVPNGGWQAVASRVISSPGNVTLAFEVYLPPASLDAIAVVSISAATTESINYVLDRHTDSLWYVEAVTQLGGGLAFTMKLDPQPATQTWNPMTLHVHFGAPALTNIVLDYVDANQTPQHATSPNVDTPDVANASVNLGLVAPGGTAGAVSVYFDDVVVTSL